MACISSRLEAASVLTSSTRRPASARAMAVAVETDVLPTPPLPVKKMNRVGSFSQSMKEVLISSGVRKGLPKLSHRCCAGHGQGLVLDSGQENPHRICNN